MGRQFKTTLMRREASVCQSAGILVFRRKSRHFFSPLLSFIRYFSLQDAIMILEPVDDFGVRGSDRNRADEAGSAP